MKRDSIHLLKYNIMNATEESTLDIKTNFFQAIAALKIDGNFNLTIQQLKDGRMVVSTILNNENVGDNARKRIIPLNLTGTAKELDLEYFKTISSPIKKTSGILTNMESYLKSVEEANKNSRLEQDKKKKNEKSKAEENTLNTESKEMYKEQMETALQFEKEMKYNEALKALPKAEEYPKYATEITKKRMELEAKSKLVTMF